MKSLALPFFFISAIAFAEEAPAPEKKNLEEKTPAVETVKPQSKEKSYEMDTFFQSVNLQSIGGAGGPLVEYTRIKGKDAVFAGGFGYGIFDHNFILGGAGEAVASTIPISDFEGRPRSLVFGYGGLLLGYILAPTSAIHLTTSVLLGAGGVGGRYTDRDTDEEKKNDHSKVMRTKPFFIIKPTIAAEFNISSWFRISAGISENLCIGDIASADLKRADISLPTAQLMFIFGRF